MSEEYFVVGSHDNTINPSELFLIFGHTIELATLVSFFLWSLKLDSRNWTVLHDLRLIMG